MKYEEFKTKLTDIVKDADTALSKLPAFLEEVKTDYEALSGAIEKVTESDKRIRDLQDTNMKLFLAQTGQAAEPDEEPEPEGMEAVDKFISDIMSEE